MHPVHDDSISTTRYRPADNGRAPLLRENPRAFAVVMMKTVQLRFVFTLMSRDCEGAGRGMPIQNARRSSPAS